MVFSPSAIYALDFKTVLVTQPCASLRCSSSRLDVTEGKAMRAASKFVMGTVKIVLIIKLTST